MTSLAEKDFPVQQWCLKKLFTVFVGTFWGPLFISLQLWNSIPSYFTGGLRFVVFSIVEGNVNIFCGITRRYALIISLFSIKKKKKLFEQDIIFVKDLLFELDTTNSFTIVSNKISKISYLIWAGPVSYTHLTLPTKRIV